MFLIYVVIEILSKVQTKYWLRLIRKVFSGCFHIFQYIHIKKLKKKLNSVWGSCQHQQLCSWTAITNQKHRNKRQSNVIYDPTDNRKRQRKTKIHEWKPPKTMRVLAIDCILCVCECAFFDFFFRFVLGAFIIIKCICHVSLFMLHAYTIHNSTTEWCSLFESSIDENIGLVRDISISDKQLSRPSNGCQSRN